MLPLHAVDALPQHKDLRLGCWLGAGVVGGLRLLADVEGTQGRPLAKHAREEDPTHSRDAVEVVGIGVLAGGLYVERKVRAGRGAFVGGFVDERGAGDTESERLDLVAKQPDQFLATRRRQAVSVTR